MPYGARPKASPGSKTEMKEAEPETKTAQTKRAASADAGSRKKSEDAAAVLQGVLDELKSLRAANKTLKAENASLLSENTRLQGLVSSGAPKGKAGAFPVPGLSDAPSGKGN